MRIFIAGIDGYLGWSLALYLGARGHEVAGADLYLRREWVSEVGGQSATPILSMADRQKVFQEKFKKEMRFFEGDLQDYSFVRDCLSSFKPDAIVHLGENPSAPYSMIDLDHCVFTHKNNMIGTLNIVYALKEICPHAHLLKLGTMGEYGTPNVVIPEGFFEIEYRGRKDTLPFPRQANSWYHQTKVHDTNNIMMACRLWGLRSTDIMQGVVYGTRIDEMGDDERMLTRLDFDECFGTAINRFCCQAVIGHPLTLYGQGHQKRGFLPLRDSMQCLSLALENPPDEGEYRVFNQFEEVYDLTELAHKVQKIGNALGLNVEIQNLDNPRKENEDHFYQADHKHLLDLGYKPTSDMDVELKTMLSDLIRYKNRIEEKVDSLVPNIRWDGSRQKSECISGGNSSSRVEALK